MADTTNAAAPAKKQKKKKKRQESDFSGNSRALDAAEKVRNTLSKRGSFEPSGGARLYDSAEKASSEILSRLGFPDGVDGQAKTALDLGSVGLLSSQDGGGAGAGAAALKQSRTMNTMNYDSLHQLRAALGSRSIMAEPSLKDLCVDGETFAGIAEDESVLHDWLAHIDSIIDKSLDADLDVDPFDMSTLLIRKATIYCSLGRQEDSVACASAALDLVVTSLALYRLACAHYMLSNYTEALQFILEANQLERFNVHIESTLLVIMLRLRSRKDRPDAVIID